MPRPSSSATRKLTALSSPPALRLGLRMVKGLALERLGVLSADQVQAHDHGQRVHTAGLIITRQRLSSCSGGC